MDNAPGGGMARYLAAKHQQSLIACGTRCGIARIARIWRRHYQRALT